MKNVKEKICEKIKDKDIYLFLGITLIFFGIFCSIQYAPDTYYVFNNGTREVVRHFFSCGRIVTAIFIGGIKGILKLSNQLLYMISYVIAIVASTFAMYELYQMIGKEIKSRPLSLMISILVVLNIFSLELFVYIEKGIMMLSVLLSILAVKQTEKVLGGSRKSILSTIILLFVAMCSYQGTVGIYIALSIIYIIKYSKNIGNFLKNNIIVALMYGIPAIINFLFTKIFFNNARITGKIVIYDSVLKIFNGLKSVFITTHQLFPQYIFLISIILLIVYIIYKIAKKDEKTGEKVLEILGIFYLILGNVLVTIFPQLLQSTNSIWLVARTTYPIASMIGILLIYLNMRVSLQQKQINIILTLGLILLMIQFKGFVRFEIDNYKVGYDDMIVSKQIVKNIEDYEQKTGEKITKIAYYKDKNPGYTYPQISASGDMNIKAFSTEWSTKDILKNYTGKKELILIEKKVEYEKYFKDRDWKYFDEEQLIFEGDVLHICSY